MAWLDGTCSQEGEKDGGTWVIGPSPLQHWQVAKPPWYLRVLILEGVCPGCSDHSGRGCGSAAFLLELLKGSEGCAFGKSLGTR